MRYCPERTGKDPRVAAGIALAAAAAAVISSRFVSGYRWAFDLFAVIALTVFLYVLTRYNVRFAYRLEPRPGARLGTLTSDVLRVVSLRDVEFLISRQRGKESETVECRFYLSELVAAEKWPASAAERRALCKKRPEMRLFRYTVSIRPDNATLLVFSDEGYGTIGVLLEPGDALDAIFRDAAARNAAESDKE